MTPNPVLVRTGRQRRRFVKAVPARRTTPRSAARRWSVGVDIRLAARGLLQTVAG